VKLLINIDGAAKGNPGPAGCGIVIRDHSGETLLDEGKYLGKGTNNFAEYQGLLFAFERARELGGTELVIRSDSELLVRQMQGRYKVKSANIRPLHQRAREEVEKCAAGRCVHLPREENGEADELASEAIREARDGRLRSPPPLGEG